MQIEQRLEVLEVHFLDLVVLAFFVVHQVGQQMDLHVPPLHVLLPLTRQIACGCIQIDICNTQYNHREYCLDEICSNIGFFKDLRTYPVQFTHDAFNVFFCARDFLPCFFKTTPRHDTNNRRVNCHVFRFF